MKRNIALISLIMLAASLAGQPQQVGGDPLPDGGAYIATVCKGS